MTGAITALTLREWWSLRISLIWAYKGVPPSKHHTGAEPEATVQTWRLDAGSVQIHTGQATHTVEAGQWAIIPAGKAGHNFTDDARLLDVNFTAHWIDGRPLFELDEPLILFAAAHPTLTRAANSLVRACPAYDIKTREAPPLIEARTSLAAFMRLRGRFHRFIETWSSALQDAGIPLSRTAETDPRLAEAVHLIDAMPLHQPIDHSALAGSLGLSLSQLNRLFVQHLNGTARAYEQKRRLVHAKRGLIDPHAPIKQVAYRLGFREPSHFSAWFKKLTGYTPRQYRQHTEHPGEAVA